MTFADCTGWRRLALMERMPLSAQDSGKRKRSEQPSDQSMM
jgi:hypothetical protein